MCTGKQLTRYRETLIKQALKARQKRRDNDLLPACNAAIRRTDPGSLKPRRVR